MDRDDRDDIYAGADLSAAEIEVARRLVLEKPSPSYLQRQMRIPYSHAMRLIGLFEAEQIISQPNSAGLRRVVSGPSGSGK